MPCRWGEARTHRAGERSECCRRKKVRARAGLLGTGTRSGAVRSAATRPPHAAATLWRARRPREVPRAAGRAGRGALSTTHHGSGAAAVLVVLSLIEGVVTKGGVVSTVEGSASRSLSLEEHIYLGTHKERTPPHQKLSPCRARRRRTSSRRSASRRSRRRGAGRAAPTSSATIRTPSPLLHPRPPRGGSSSHPAPPPPPQSSHGWEGRRSSSRPVPVPAPAAPLAEAICTIRCEHQRRRTTSPAGCPFCASRTADKCEHLSRHLRHFRGQENGGRARPAAG